MKNISATPVTAALRATIEDMLKRLQVDEQLDWEELEKACDVARAGLYAAVRAAIKRVGKLGLHFRTVRGVGVQRIDDASVVGSVCPDIAAGVGRKARKLRGAVESVDFSKLDNTKRVQAVGYATVAELTIANVRPKAVSMLGKQRDLNQIAAESLKTFEKV